MHLGTISAREELQVSWGVVSKHSSFASYHHCENPPPSPNNSLVTNHSGWMPCMSSLLGNHCVIHRDGLWASLFGKPQEREGGNKNRVTTSHTDHVLDRVYPPPHTSRNESQYQILTVHGSLRRTGSNNEARQGVPAVTSQQRQLQNRFFQRKHVSSLYP